MKIIFLDFDGVIRVPVFGGPRIEGEFCETRMGRVAGLVAAHDAKIVISSDWRCRHSYHEIVRMLSPLITSNRLHQDWKTPILQPSPENENEVQIPRGSEIVAWLYNNPEPRQFVILDDLASSHFPLMTKRLVRCDLQDGFSEEKAALADQLLCEYG